jgi:hypothetical protein
MLLELLGKIDPMAVASFSLDVVGSLVVGYILLRVGLKCYWTYENYSWRKNVKVGDNCYFHNIGGGITDCKVKQVSDDKKKVLCEHSTANSSSCGWHDVAHLKHLTDTDLEVLREKRLQKTLRSLRKYRG